MFKLRVELSGPPDPGNTHLIGKRSTPTSSLRLFLSCHHIAMPQPRRRRRRLKSGGWGGWVCFTYPPTRYVLFEIPIICVLTNFLLPIGNGVTFGHPPHSFWAHAPPPITLENEHVCSFSRVIALCCCHHHCTLENEHTRPFSRVVGGCSFLLPPSPSPCHLLPSKTSISARFVNLYSFDIACRF